MITRLFVLMTLYTRGFAYWDELPDCMTEVYLPSNPAVQKMIDVLNDCNDKMTQQGNQLVEDDTACEAFNKKIAYDHCFFHEAGWINENETKINYIGWGQDNENMAEMMGFQGEEAWEKIDQCLCDVKDKLKAEGKEVCGNKSNGIGHYYLSSIGRCAITGMQAHCNAEREKKNQNETEK